MFEKARENYKNTEYKIMIAKSIDKYEFCKRKNKITYTDFLNIQEISILKKILNEEKIENYILFGGREEADRKLLIFFPDKLKREDVQKNYKKIFKIIRIELPENIEYKHGEFLSGIMKLGIKREKFGDIIVTNSGADIIVLSEIADILCEDLKSLTRFRKSKIFVDEISNIIDIKTGFENINIIVSSIRLDNFVSELARCSRTKASEYIKLGRVFVNSINEFKDSKKITIGDIITIRGKGKFIFDNIERETKSGKYLLNIRKYK